MAYRAGSFALKGTIQTTPVQYARQMVLMDLITHFLQFGFKLIDFVLRHADFGARRKKVIAVIQCAFLHLLGFFHKLHQQLIKFFDEDCRISNLELIDEDGYSSYFSNDCARIDIYKKYPTLANTESFIRETYNYNKYTGLQRVKISSIKDNILNIVRRAVEPTIFNNDKFIYKVYYDNSYNFAYEYLISKKHGHQ